MMTILEWIQLEDNWSLLRFAVFVIVLGLLFRMALHVIVYVVGALRRGIVWVLHSKSMVGRWYVTWRSQPKRFFRYTFKPMWGYSRDAILTFEDKKRDHPRARRYRPALEPAPWEIKVTCRSDGVEEFWLHIHPQFECTDSGIKVYLPEAHESASQHHWGSHAIPTRTDSEKWRVRVISLRRLWRYAHLEHGEAEKFQFCIEGATQTWRLSHRSLFPLRFMGTEKPRTKAVVAVKGRQTRSPVRVPPIVQEIPAANARSVDDLDDEDVRALLNHFRKKA